MAQRQLRHNDEPTLSREERIAHLDEFGRQLHNLLIKGCRAISKANWTSGNRTFKIEGKTVRLSWGAHRGDGDCYTLYVSIFDQVGLAPRVRQAAIIDEHIYFSQKPKSFDLWMTRNREVISEHAAKELRK